jgi:hypothetical protein
MKQVPVVSRSVCYSIIIHRQKQRILIGVLHLVIRLQNDCSK